MKRKVTTLALPLLMAASLPFGAAWAQAPAGGHQRPSTETINRLQDGRIAMAKTALKLTDAQQKLWAPVEELVRKNYADRETRRAEWEAKRGDAAKATPVPLPEKLQKASERMTKRAAAMKAMADAVGPLYATFSDEQKAVAGPVFGQLFGGHGHGHKGHGHRFGMRPMQAPEPKKG